jgi:hypothetical protein
VQVKVHTPAPNACHRYKHRIAKESPFHLRDRQVDGGVSVAPKQQMQLAGMANAKPQIAHVEASDCRHRARITGIEMGCECLERPQSIDEMLSHHGDTVERWGTRPDDDEPRQAGISETAI